MRRLLALATILITALLTGCASAPYMPLADKNEKVEASPPLYLMSVVIKNKYRTRWQPRVLNVILDNGVEGKERLAQVLRMDGQGAVESPTDGDTTTYLVRFRPAESMRLVRGFNSMASAFPFHGLYFVPLHAALPQFDSGVHYLGSIRASIRERKDGEFRAGPPIPLLDQAASGASGGTFDVDVVDAYDSDVALFRETFAALKDVNVGKSVLPPWNRATAQQFWEKN